MPEQMEREAQRQKERLLKTEELRARYGPKRLCPGRFFVKSFVESGLRMVQHAARIPEEILEY